MAVDFDTVVIGAGVIGLAAARACAVAGRQVLVIEKASRAGTETSSRNSEVIHAGIYYPKGSLKAQLCTEGRQLLYDYCAAHSVSAKRIGKIIVATSPEEEVKLQIIKTQAEANGVDDVQWLSQSEVTQREPEIFCTKALFSPSTGIVDAPAFMLALQGEAQAHGADIAFNTTCSNARKKDDTFVISAEDAGGDAIDISCTHLINCAGHGAHDIARAMCAAHTPPQYFARGHYCSVSGKSPFSHLIYPVPVSGALGIHATLDIAGAVRFGPDIQWIDAPDHTMPEGLPENFSAAVASYWPGVRARELSPSYCGIRPKIHGPELGFADFCIQTPAQHGVEGLINLFGIESPGLTSSLAIAKRIVEYLDKAGHS